MLPRKFPAFPDRNEFDLHATMDPAKEVGGDFYDFFLLDDDHIVLVMADVSGKGVPAALFMVIAKTLIKNRAFMGGSPSEILEYTNEQLCSSNDSEMFVTVWLAIIEISTGKGIAANAGHEHPVIKRAGGDYELVEYRHSPAVATIEGLHFMEHEFELHPGDNIFVYTDGVPEATNAENELFGNERMLEALNRKKDSNSAEILDNMKLAIDEFVGEAPQFDDITMLAFRYFGKQ
jgi:sigma-B regulation protein RsbU (phosphoserine phosphatase)